MATPSRLQLGNPALIAATTMARPGAAGMMGTTLSTELQWTTANRLVPSNSSASFWGSLSLPDPIKTQLTRFPANSVNTSWRFSMKAWVMAEQPKEIFLAPQSESEYKLRSDC